MVTKAKKMKGPTWKKINGEECVPSELHRKDNEEIRKTLKEFGFTVWDHCNVWEEGYVITARKLIPEFSKNRNPYMYFQWSWRDEGHEYWCARMRGSFDYFPDDRYLHPWGAFEITDITKRNIQNVPIMEQRIISALTTQTVLV